MEAIIEIIGSTVLSVEGLSVDSEEIIIETDNGTYKIYHYQNCCENVRVDDVVGELKIGSKILDFIEKTNSDTPKEEECVADSFTWTFYTIVTDKGYCDIKWYGSSNGYYSESVDFEKIN